MPTTQQSPTNVNTPKTSTRRSANSGPKHSKKDRCIALLKRPRGATLTEMQKVMGWQIRSLRGFLATSAKKVEGFTLESEKPEGKVRRYHLVSVKD